MIVAGVWTGLGFSNYKIAGPGPGFQNFGKGAESLSEKVIPATSGLRSKAVLPQASLQKSLDSQKNSPDMRKLHLI